MAAWRRSASTPLLSVVVPVYNVAHWLPDCLDSILASSLRTLDVVVVDDGSRDESAAIADGYAARDDRITVVHIGNCGLGAARNEGLRHATGDYVGFCDSDDVVPPDAYRVMIGRITSTGSDFVSGSLLRWERGRLEEPRWMRRLHASVREGISIEDHPEILGDVFAPNKLFRRVFWEDAGLSWPEGVRYEDQPTTTRAYLTGRFDVIPQHVYHWRIRSDGSSITQQRSSRDDLQDRILTKRMSWESVVAHGSPAVTETFLDRVLAGDLHRYFREIPGCDDAWWAVLRDGVLEFWGSRSLVHSGLPPVHRLTGWLVEQDRREDAALVMRYVATGRRAPRVGGEDAPRIDVPGLDAATVDPAALALRPHEV